MEQIPQYDPLFLAWAAGFIDGEGCFSICTRQRPGRSPSFESVLVVAQCYRPPLEELQRAFGGCIFALQIREDRWTANFAWRLGARGMAHFLPLIEPHLRVKQQQCALMRDFLALVLRPGRPNGRAGIPAAEVVVRAEFCSKLRGINANNKGKKPISPSD